MDKTLISSVFKREALWSSSHEHHKNVGVLIKLWEEVAAELKKDVKTVKARWRNLRHYFFKECSKMERPLSEDSSGKVFYKSSWQYYDQLMFLKINKYQSEYSPTESNSAFNNEEYYVSTDPLSEEQHYEDCESKFNINNTEDFQDYSASQQKKIRLSRSENIEKNLEIHKKKLEILERESLTKKSDDLLFFASLLPYMELIPLRRKLKLRSNIQNLILDEIETKTE